MPRPNAATKKTRLNLEIAVSVRKRLEWVQKQTHADSITEVVRRALAVYEHVVKAKADGARLIVEKDGERVELQIF